MTSAHVAFTGTSIVAQGVAWGNGGLNSGPGPAFTNTCTTCHNPHGNGYYRILVPHPSDGDGPLFEMPPVGVTDAALPTGAGAAGTRNYTNIWGRTLADVAAGTYPGGGTVASGGDYWRDYLPWNGVPTEQANGLPGPAPVGSVNGDRPMYVPNGTGANANLTGFRGQITAWCSTCHTRHDQVTGATVDTGDDIYRFRHDVGQSECTQCHVAHGSNAAMPGTFSPSLRIRTPRRRPRSHPDPAACSRSPTEAPARVATIPRTPSRPTTWSRIPPTTSVRPCVPIPHLAKRTPGVPPVRCGPIAPSERSDDQRPLPALRAPLWGPARRWRAARRIHAVRALGASARPDP